MRLFIRHHTEYRFTEPQARLVQLLRLTPTSHAGQTVADWRIDVEYDARLKPFREGFGNEATMLYVMASVQPPTGKQKTVKINYIISPSNVTFSDLPENKKHVVVDCMVVAFDKDGKEVAHASDTLDGAIPQAAYDAVMKQGLPANQEIELKPGTYNLRLGVMDHATQQIGTVDVPLEITDGSLGK